MKGETPGKWLQETFNFWKVWVEHFFSLEGNHKLRGFSGLGRAKDCSFFEGAKRKALKGNLL